MSERVLVVDDETNMRKVLRAVLRRAGFSVEVAGDGHEALACLCAGPTPALVLTDLRMPGLDGMGLLAQILERWPALPVVVITAHGTVDTAVEAMKRGAFDFVTKPFDQDELLAVVRKALATGRLSDRAAAPAEAGARGRFGLIGASGPMQRVFGIVERVAKTPSTVLITGESGTGKELIAKALHVHSPRRERPFIRVNCAAIPDSLIESELFGYEKGAFTGAVTSKPGRFELADQGTLFLDEIGEISTEMQVKLLRVIQESEFERVGGVSTQRVDVRLVTATNRDLAARVQAGAFREDLYYRLNVVPIHLPPLRERVGDLPLLIDHLLVRYAARLERAQPALAEEARGLMEAYAWPGNIRELENVIERSLLFCDGGQITAEDLPGELRGEAPGLGGGRPVGPLTVAGATGLKDAVRQTTLRLERELIEQALRETGGNVTRAARQLAISRKSLQTKMKEFGLRDEE